MPEEIVEEPLKTEVCSFLDCQIRSLIESVEREPVGIKPPITTWEEWLSLIYYANRVKEVLKCPK